ncbi:MAG: CHAT domain-containing protein, partial [Deltaproteobacteria bacterium]|nr:CHAT domain-containing protein [Deltaproteobacteria bacterium]
MAKKRGVTKVKKSPKKIRQKRESNAEQNEMKKIYPSGYRLKDNQIELALLTGEHSGLLEDYFGESDYLELREMSQEAAAKTRKKGPKVLIIPGILGSKLGEDRSIFDDIIWIDPLDIALGKLYDLSLDKDSKKIKPLGVLLFAYLKIKLFLNIRGYDAEFYPYDWRRGLDTAGNELARYLKREKAKEIFIVGHSMGGLITRAALSIDALPIKRLIMLGTPNFGSFMAPQALIATHPSLRKVGALDMIHTAEELVEKVFNTFPGLYHLLPFSEKFDSVDLYKIETWPKHRPRPRISILERVKKVHESLAKADDRFYLIAGVNRETATNLRKEGDEFVYDVSIEGDGTVPLEFAMLPGAKTYYVEEGHGSLPNNRLVEQAVADLIETGKTGTLPDQWAPPTRRVRTVRDSELIIEPYDGRKGRELSQREIRHIVDDLVSPASSDSLKTSIRLDSKIPGKEPIIPYTLDRVTIARRGQHRLEFRLALGSITEADSSACVLGVFRDVDPVGAARALDERVDGAITEFTMRRMFSGNVGEIFIMPTGRHPLSAGAILLAGLGPFDRFDEEVQRLVAENIIRTLVHAKIEDFATVLMGAGSGRSATSTLQNLVAGFVRGLIDADKEYRFRSITICETDNNRYDEMKRELYRLSSTKLFEEVEVTFYESELPPPLITKRIKRLEDVPDHVYLIVAQQASTNNTIDFRTSVLTSGAKATVVTGVKSVERRKLDDHLDLIETNRFGFSALPNFGKGLADLVLADEVLTILPSLKEKHLIVAHDAPASRIPWETLNIDGWSPGAGAGLTRKYIADNLSVAKWLEQRRFDSTLDLLLVVNPTGDLAGAEEEGRRVHELFDSHPSVNIMEFREEQAKKNVLMDAFRSGKYDVIHYAGHAFFDEDSPSRSGILCHGKEVLSGSELAGVGNLPALIFFNACEAGRIRAGKGSKDPELRMAKRVQRAVGLAEAFLRGGVANYVG